MVPSREMVLALCRAVLRILGKPLGVLAVIAILIIAGFIFALAGIADTQGIVAAARASWKWALLHPIPVCGSAALFAVFCSFIAAHQVATEDKERDQKIKEHVERVTAELRSAFNSEFALNKYLSLQLVLGKDVEKLDSVMHVTETNISQYHNLINSLTGKIRISAHDTKVESDMKIKFCLVALADAERLCTNETSITDAIRVETAEVRFDEPGEVFSVEKNQLFMNINFDNIGKFAVASNKIKGLIGKRRTAYYAVMREIETMIQKVKYFNYKDIQS